MSIVARILAIDIPVTPAQPPHTGGAGTILGWLAWGAFACCVAGIIICGAMLAISHHRGGGGSEHGGRVLGVLAGCILVGAASGIVGTLSA
jgi:hypothetical protein